MSTSDTAGYPYHDDCSLPEQTPLASAPTGEQQQIEQSRSTRRYTADEQLATLLAVKEMLADGTCKNVQEACKKVNLHHTTYYRYQQRFKDVKPTETIRAMVSAVLKHNPEATHTHAPGQAEGHKKTIEHMLMKIGQAARTNGGHHLPEQSSWQPAQRQKTVFEAILVHGNDDCFEPTGDGDGFVPTDAIPGTEEKIKVLITRIRRGLPLHHPGDYTLLDDKERR